VLQRGGGTVVDVPRASWTTADPHSLAPGDRLSLPLSPPAAAGERLAVRVMLREPSLQLASLAVTTGAAASGLGDATLHAFLTPSSLHADGAAAARLTVRVSHPAGAAAVARVVADLHALSFASSLANVTVPLNDAGLDGDEVGGDGNWTALVRPPAMSAVGTYSIPVNATGIDGRRVGTATVPLTIVGNLSTAAGSGGTGGTGGSGGTGGGANHNGSGNFSGPCYNCTITGGVVILEGTRLPAPTSQNVTTMLFNNWTWDRFRPEALANDAAVARIVSDTWSWSIYIKFVYSTQTGNVPGIARLEMWNANASTVWLPASQGRVALANLSLDLLNPTSSGFVCSTGCAAPMTYNRADLRGSPTFLVSFLRDETNNYQTTEIGIQSIDAVVR